MSTKLYCIKHETMVDGEMGRVFGHIVKPLVYPPDWEIDFCEFEEGFATCPEPLYDLEGYIEIHGQPPSITSNVEDLEEIFPIWTFNPETQEMVIEERVQ